jgi:hypothetical protein
MKLSFLVRKAEAARDLRELSAAEAAMIAGGDDGGTEVGPGCPGGGTEQTVSSLKCTRDGCRMCTADDTTCVL